ncbi:MAG: FMN-binding protein, partial [Actinomycetia bacterium]|nr:FMN-binding protein [Actinomycetes bacterium]
SAVVHPIEVVKPGRKSEPWQIDGITGATISSVAIGNILRHSTSRWMPRVRRQMDDFEPPGGEDDG